MDEELGLDQGDLSRFLLTHSMHLVTEFNSQASWAIGVLAEVGGAGWGCPWQPPCQLSLPLQTSPKIFAARILNHLLLFVNQTLAEHRELLEGFGEAAPPFRGQVPAGRGLGGGRATWGPGRVGVGPGGQRGLAVGRCCSWSWTWAPAMPTCCSTSA